MASAVRQTADASSVPRKRPNPVRFERDTSVVEDVESPEGQMSTKGSKSHPSVASAVRNTTGLPTLLKSRHVQSKMSEWFVEVEIGFATVSVTKEVLSGKLYTVGANGAVRVVHEWHECR